MFYYTILFSFANIMYSLFFPFSKVLIPPRTRNRNLLIRFIIIIIIIIIISINLLLNDYCEFLMTTVYEFIHYICTSITTAIELIFLN